MKKSATLVKSLPSYLDGSLYQLSEPIFYIDQWRQKLKTTWINIKTEDGFTEAFAADVNGHFLSQIPIVKSRMKGKKHQECLERLGFKMIN